MAEQLQVLAWLSILISLAWIVLALFWFAATRECAAVLRDVLKEIRALRRKLDAASSEEAPGPESTTGPDEEMAFRLLDGGQRDPVKKRPT